ncbi:hypothetical protein PR048_011857 [Dryococelus australis]|uniref:Uncharacterized protein n=1 Tax=Dryococelus australis TaxID=614101 RepID=A0ABQ9HMQ2_9NEOP|nr:hypothetical protein PR048_011857 [Dryococelus australis]
MIASARFLKNNTCKSSNILYDMGTKNEEDIFLSSLIGPQEIKRRRPRK